MKFFLADNFTDNDYSLMRKCGYQPNLANKNSLSYLRKLHYNQFYPRFHLFLERKLNKLIFNIHLDQKKPSYQGQKAHSGESHSQVIIEEINRIKNILTNN